MRGWGWGPDTGAAWRQILDLVHTYAGLEPALLGRVEELIDFVTAPHNYDQVELDPRDLTAQYVIT